MGHTVSAIASREVGEDSAAAQAGLQALTVLSVGRSLSLPRNGGGNAPKRALREKTYGARV